MSLDLILLHLTLEEGEADVSLRCRDGAVAGHRLVLAALSPMLCRAFRELGGDEEKVCIQLPDFTTQQVNLSTKSHMSICGNLVPLVSGAPPDFRGTPGIRGRLCLILRFKL